MSWNLGARLKALTRVVAKRFSPPLPARELSDPEFVWLLARFVHRVKERLAAPEAEWPRLQERNRREDEELYLAHPHFRRPPAPAGVRADEPRRAADLVRDFLKRRAAREVVPDRLDLAAEDRAALVEASRRAEAALGLPPLPAGPLVFTESELEPFVDGLADPHQVYRIKEAIRRGAGTTSGAVATSIPAGTPGHPT
jgi:hypothetical protein